MHMSVDRIAHAARADFESSNIDPDLLARLYGAYSPEAGDPRLFVTRARLIFPLGNCGLASLYLKHELGQGTVVQGSYDAQPHTFLSLGDGHIVDITADQFSGGPRVFVGELAEPWQKYKLEQH